MLAACGFDMKFQYVLPGWEGSATDARILQHALSRPDGLIVPPGINHNNTMFKISSWFLYVKVTSPAHLFGYRPLLLGGCWLP